MIIDTIIIVLIVLSGLLLLNLFSSALSDKDIKILRLLFIYHLIVAFFYFLFTRNGGGDAWGYWLHAKQMTNVDFIYYITEERGTGFMFAFNYFFSNILGMGFLANTMFYAWFGYIGFVYFYCIINEIIPYNSTFYNVKLFPLLFFLPNLHFWSSGVGKDSLLFMCVGMFAYGMMEIKRRFPLLIFSSFLAFVVRPHIFLFLIAAFGITYIFNKKTPVITRFLVAAVLLAGVIVTLPSVAEFAKIEELTTENYMDFSENRAGGLSRSHTSSAIDISSYPYPLKVFTFLYRPLFFDISTIPSVVASFENLLLLILSISVLLNSPVQTFRKAPFLAKALLALLIIGAFAFAPLLGNLGIMLRMRNMLLPGMIIYILWSRSYNLELRISRHKKISDMLESRNESDFVSNNS